MAALPTWPYEPGGTRGRYVGDAVGSEVSGFVVDEAPGGGPPLHTHPYSETFVVLDGQATFTLGERTLRAGRGDVVVAPADVPHRFVGEEPGRLRMVTVHASPRMEQDDLE